MKQLLYLFWAASWTFHFSPTNAQSTFTQLEDFQCYIDTADLRRYVFQLSAPEFEGRWINTESIGKVVSYLENQFSAYLEPVTRGEVQGHLQPFPIVYFRNLDTAHLELQVDRVSMEKVENDQPILTLHSFPLQYRQDFVPHSNTYLPSPEKSEMVFAGYGIDEPVYSDYAKLDVKGKTVVVLDGQPQKGINYVLTNSEKIDKTYLGFARKMEIAKEKGAKGLVFVMDEDEYDPYYRNREQRVFPYFHADTLRPTDFHVFIVSNDAAIKLLGCENAKEYRKKKRSFARKLKPELFFGKTANFQLHQRVPWITKQYEGVNILGYVRGDSLPEEVVLLSAHYDHLGYSPKTGKLRPGADDNASGVAALLETAEAFWRAKQAGISPKRSILFIAWAGEEIGTLGSLYYTKHQPLHELSKTVANLNVDMIGRTGFGHRPDEEYVYVIGSEMVTPKLDSLIVLVNASHAQLTLNATYKRPFSRFDYFYRSDHIHFHEQGIPVAFFFGGEHPDYHQPTDTAEKINYPLLEKRSKLLFQIAVALSKHGLE